MSFSASRIVDVPIVVDTAIYAAADVLFIPQLISNLFREKDFPAILQSLVLTDENNQGAAFDMYFLDSNVSFGALNAPAAPAAASIRTVLGKLSVLTTDYKTVGAMKVATLNNLNLILKPASGSADIWVVGVNGAGTPTYTTLGLRGRFGIVYPS